MISLQNPETPGDEVYTRDVLIVDNSEYLHAVHQLRDLIVTYCTLREMNVDISKNMEILEKIDNIICEIQNIQYTEFLAYWKCVDTTYGIYKSLNKSDRLKVLIVLLDRYCERRRKLYEQFGYTHVTQQALYDSTAARSQGNTAVRKIEQLFKDVTNSEQFIGASDSEEFLRQELSLMRINKTNFRNLRNLLKMKYEFGTNHQGKIPDVAIKISKNIFIVEAKHVKELGGAQDKQISELIDYIKQEEKNQRFTIHYVSFLDGIYFNKFVNPNQNTTPYRQRQSIKQAIEQFKQNYFVNTEGLRTLLRDALQEHQNSSQTTAEEAPP
jgi:hypothetical protein